MSSHGTESSGDRCTGLVKWFNNRVGYGFVTATSGDKEGSDIFAHHSCIQVEKEQYKYLVQGEYVEFSVIPTEEGVQHEFQAGDIRGIYSGKLMCETRHDNRSTRRPRRNVEETSESAEGAQEQEASKSTTNRRGGGPRQGMGRGRRQGNNRANKKTQEQQAEA